MSPLCVTLSPCHWPFVLGSYSREQPLFLQLKDYFWVKTPSLYELPYGTKGSGESRWHVRLSVCPSRRPPTREILTSKHTQVDFSGANV